METITADFSVIALDKIEVKERRRRKKRKKRRTVRVEESERREGMGEKRKSTSFHATRTDTDRSPKQNECSLDQYQLSFDNHLKLKMEDSGTTLSATEKRKGTIR